MTTRTHLLPHQRAKLLPTIVLLAGALYCLVPVAWVIVAATKASGELFSTFTFAPGTGLLDNLRDLFSYGDGRFVLWAANSALYAVVGSAASTLISTLAGYAMAKYDFRGRTVLFYAILAGVLVPGMTLAIPQYLIMSETNLVGSYWSVLLPGLISPFGIYLARVYALSSVPDATLEAARIDGAGEYRIFGSIGLPMMLPGMVTIFMLQFVGTWNNFLLPYIMLSDESKFPITVGLYTLLAKGSSEPALYGIAIVGAAVSVVPLIALLLFLQRFWRLDLLSGGLKG
ncbi:multiple sugar transport system permease protein [Nonomuraea thailandensis]|uniref:Multiple sugar transport system permease protein n=1 Tax=Nonomuraea thailandensis TaxID=1188745 RepID=A0A9X2GJ28_9ACTN|nr:carbohydrate ABC transporter permease [Nonomuraea thailandensis]MCP2358640.1 multiple sugar transport system permease protein [Nonomuraea thailandensis]